MWLLIHAGIKVNVTVVIVATISACLLASHTQITLDLDTHNLRFEVNVMGWINSSFFFSERFLTRLTRNGLPLHMDKLQSYATLFTVNIFMDDLHVISTYDIHSTHYGLEMPYAKYGLGQHCFGWCLVAYLLPNYGLNQCWLYCQLTPENKIK